jgi:hypothetical protein
MIIIVVVRIAAVSSSMDSSRQEIAVVQCKQQCMQGVYTVLLSETC